MKVLIVDDELAITEVLADILEHEGFSVDVARDGAEGLEQIRRNRPDVVLLDMMMPVMDGAAMLQAMRADGHALPVVMMSAARIPSEVQECATAVLAKPFDLDALVSAVGQAAGRAGAR